MSARHNVKIRLDQLLLQKQMAESRAQAQALILAGKVSCHGEVLTKAGQLLDDQAELIVEAAPRYVSRAGDKLAGALKAFGIDQVSGQWLDCGISTGGFSDCLLQHGAEQIWGVDVAYGQVAWQVRQNPRLHLLERTNFRYLHQQPELAMLQHSFDGMTLDLAFISLTKVIDSVLFCLKPGAILLTLVKPQFELKPSLIGKGGIVRDHALQMQAVESVCQFYCQQQFQMLSVTPSVITGKQGNQEYFVHWLSPA